MNDFNEAAERENSDAFMDRLEVENCIEMTENERAHYKAGWLAAKRQAHEEMAALRAFAQEVLRDYQLEVEGIQELATKYGLVAPVKATERCGEDCRCAEDCGFPVTCYRWTELLKGEPAKPEPRRAKPNASGGYPVEEHTDG